jgi:hypothetical protein
MKTENGCMAQKFNYQIGLFFFMLKRTFTGYHSFKKHQNSLPSSVLASSGGCKSSKKSERLPVAVKTVFT